MAKSFEEREYLRYTELVTRLIEAAIADSWKGAGPPEQHPLIEAEYDQARKLLDDAVKGWIKP